MPLDFIESSLLDVLKEQLKGMDAEFASLTQKAQQIILVSSSIIGIAALLNTYLPTSNAFPTSQPTAAPLPPSPLTELQTKFILAALAIYIFIIVMHLWATWPRGWSAYPVDPAPSNLQAMLKMNEKDYFDSLLKAYYTCIHQNQPVLDHKATILRLITLSMFIEVILIVVSRII